MNMTPLEGSSILEKLVAHGYEAYFVGGCVRDLCLGKEPKDIDITTNACPDDVEAIFEKTIPTGKDYGTITVMEEGIAFEVTTFRLESDYDGRRPRVVAFAKTLIEDLSRRDFTMNAMALDLNGVLHDPFDGRKDLEDGVLRFVGNPAERIYEDKIRMLRYVRFLCQYNLEPSDRAFGLGLPVDIRNLSAERVREEFNKIVMSDQATRGIQLLADYGLLVQFFPELMACKGFEQHHPAHFEDVFDHTLSVLSLCEPNLVLRLAALSHDLGKVETLTFDEMGIGHFYGHQKQSVALLNVMMKRLKYSNKEIELVELLVYHHMRLYENLTKAAGRRLLNQVGTEALDLLFALQLADTQACQGDRSLGVQQIQEMRTLCHELIIANEAFNLKDLNINGYDLQRLGYTGKEIGVVLKALLEAVISESCENTAEALSQRAESFHTKWV
jgi:tRNA nucleotidyltransferase (CCA-adding enzyme)